MPINATGPSTVLVLTNISYYRPTLFLFISQIICRTTMADAEAEKDNKSCSI